jgi:N-methylhydantoinase B
MGATRLNGVALPGKWQGRLTAGDLIEIDTPGGGGWGPPHTPDNRSGDPTFP